jgi:hypothetical protein
MLLGETGYEKVFDFAFAPGGGPSRGGPIDLDQHPDPHQQPI